MRSITKSNEESDVNHIFQKIKHSIGLELSMMEGKALIETTSPCTWREASFQTVYGPDEKTYIINSLKLTLSRISNDTKMAKMGDGKWVMDDKESYTTRI